MSTLRKASFRGVEFELADVGDEGGRRVVTHEFPNREEWHNEDLGRSPARIKLSAYLTTPELDRKREALVAALVQAGAGSLYHPFERRFLQARCVAWNLRQSKEATSRIDLDMEFVREGGEASPVLVSNTAGQLVQTRDTLQSQAVDDYARVLEQQPPSPELSAEVDGHLQTAIEWVRQAASMSYVVSDFDLQGALTRAAAEVPGLAQPLKSAQTLVQCVRALVEQHAQCAGQPAQSLTGTVSAAPTSPTERMRPSLQLMDQLRDTGDISLPRTDGAGRQSGAINASAEATERLMNRAALAELAVAVEATPYADRDSALWARYDLAQRILAAQQQTDDPTVHESLMQLLRFVGESFTRRADLLAPLESKDFGVRRTSLSAAWDLYGDPERAIDLIDGNGATHGSFLPGALVYAQR